MPPRRVQLFLTRSDLKIRAILFNLTWLGYLIGFLRLRIQVAWTRHVILLHRIAYEILIAQDNIWLRRYISWPCSVHLLWVLRRNGTNAPRNSRHIRSSKFLTAAELSDLADDDVEPVVQSLLWFGKVWMRALVHLDDMAVKFLFIKRLLSHFWVWRRNDVYSVGEDLSSGLSGSRIALVRGEQFHAGAIALSFFLLRTCA